MDQGVKRAIYGSPEKPLKIGTLEIQCYVLDGGIRVLSGRGMQNALGLGQGHGALLGRFLDHKALKPFINNDLAMALNSPIKFIRPGRVGIAFSIWRGTLGRRMCGYKHLDIGV